MKAKNNKNKVKTAIKKTRRKAKVIKNSPFYERAKAEIIALMVLAVCVAFVVYKF